MSSVTSIKGLLSSLNMPRSYFCTPVVRQLEGKVETKLQRFTSRKFRKIVPKRPRQSIPWGSKTSVFQIIQHFKNIQLQEIDISMPSYVYTTVYWSCDILLDETSTSKGIDPMVVKIHLRHQT